MAKDPYRYFRIEVRDLQEGLQKGILALEKGAARTETIALLLRLAHTLKGAARVVKLPHISEIAHALEEKLSPYRDGTAALPADLASSMLGMVDRIGAAVAALSAPAPQAATPSETPAAPTIVEEPLESVRVNVAEMDTLLDGFAEASSQLAALRRDSQALERATASQSQLSAEELRGRLGGISDRLAVGLEQLSGEIPLLRDAATQLRLLPAGVMFPALERTARDVSQMLNKKVRFETSGGDARLDAHVLAGLRDALLQLVRNAIAHGIESESQRAAASKPGEGNIRIKVEPRGNRVAFLCSDDGKGIDLDAVRRAALQRGLISESHAENLTLDDAIQLLLKGGVTTSQAATEASGRGIGLDVVRSTVARLKGTVAIQSRPGGGTTVEVCVPISLASLAGLRVEVAGRAVAIPLDAVTRTMHLDEKDLAFADGRASLLSGGESVPYVALSELLAVRGAPASRSAVLLRAGNGTAALGIDRLLGTANVVLRPVPATVRAHEHILGASLDVDGNPELVMDPVGIIAAAGLQRAESPAHGETKELPVLVIDDSLTTRMLEQSILESAGFKVELAVSAEEGLVKVRANRFGVVIVDVEMPGMDGFSFVETLQADPDLRALPCILVTSRNAPDDLQRGKRAGAKAYIVKSEFDQDFLVRTIRELTGK
jgi:two-component system chemotaxis sensor kinase CheA